MFAEVEPDGHTPESLHRAYRMELRDAIETAGVEAVVDATDLDRETVEGIESDESEGPTLRAAAAVLSVANGRDPAEIEGDARDRLLLSMSNAVLDVDALRRRLDSAMTAKELQAKIEGRHPITLEQYAEIAAAVAEEQ